jgi:uncharacterized protein
MSLDRLEGKSVPGIRFGLAFCEASSKYLVRWSGTDPAWLNWPRRTPQPSGPVNPSSSSSAPPHNPTEVVLAETETGRGILGVVDGFSPKGVEDEGEIRWRKDFLRKIGYKL